MISFLDSLGRNDYDIDGNGDVELNDYSQILAHVTDTDVSPDEAWAVADLNQNRKIDADEIEQLQVAVIELELQNEACNNVLEHIFTRMPHLRVYYEQYLENPNDRRSLALLSQ